MAGFFEIAQFFEKRIFETAFDQQINRNCVLHIMKLSIPTHQLWKSSLQKWPFVGMALVLGSIWLLSVQDFQHTLLFDHVQGLQAGDGIYLNGLRIGTVQDLEPAGRRVAVRLEIENRYRDDIPADSRFLLWRDELNPSRRSLLVLAGQSRFIFGRGSTFPEAY